MRRLIFFRHGKSDWSAGASSDHERPINDRGRRAAHTMGRFLAISGQVPDRVVCSSALRTRETLEVAIDAGGWDVDVEVLDELYLAETARVLEIIRRETDATKSLLVVGHEPTSSEMVRLLSAGQQMPGAGAVVRFPTATMARVNLSIESWSDCDYGVGELAWLVPPKLLTKGDFDFVS
jgi:phosphohistidine phosphatase